MEIPALSTNELSPVAGGVRCAFQFEKDLQCLNPLSKADGASYITIAGPVKPSPVLDVDAIEDIVELSISVKKANPKGLDGT